MQRKQQLPSATTQRWCEGEDTAVHAAQSARAVLTQCTRSARAVHALENQKKLNGHKKKTSTHLPVSKKKIIIIINGTKKI